MRGKLISILKHYPTLYNPVRKGYIYIALKFRYLEVYLFGTRVRERWWARRHLRKGTKERDDWGEGSKDWIKAYWDSRDHPHRQILVDKISTYSPGSILEIGCNCGPNLYLLAKRFPEAEIKGVDINPIAVQKGNEWLAQEGISNVKLLPGKADELGQFQDRSFDIVFTDAVLIYIGPDKIKKVMREMIRVTRRELILVEWHCAEPQNKDRHGLGIYWDGNWKRDYLALLKQFVPEEQIRATKIPEDAWPGKWWEDLGYTIEVVLSK